jgi:hypothetical protein
VYRMQYGKLHVEGGIIKACLTRTTCEDGTTRWEVSLRCIGKLYFLMKLG